MSEFAEGTIFKDIIITREPHLFTYYKQWIELDTLILVKLR